MKLNNTAIGIAKDLIAAIEEARASLVDAANKSGNDIILCWKDNGLAVFVPEGKPATPEFVRVVSVAKASVFIANTTGNDFAFPIIMNGFRQVAVPTKRADVCHKQIKEIDETLSEMRARLAELEAGEAN